MSISHTTYNTPIEPASLFNNKKKTMAYLQITLFINPENRSATVAAHQKYKATFLQTIAGAKSKGLLSRELGPLFAQAPNIRIYDVT